MWLLLSLEDSQIHIVFGTFIGNIVVSHFSNVGVQKIPPEEGKEYHFWD